MLRSLWLGLNELRFSRANDALIEDFQPFDSVGEACRALRQSAADDTAIDALRQLLAEEIGSGPLHGLTDYEVVARFETMILSGRLRLLRQVLEPTGDFAASRGAAFSESQSSASKQSSPKRTVSSATRTSTSGPSVQRPLAPPLIVTETLSFYEVVLLDELDEGIAGVPIEMTTPGGTVTIESDGAGSVRVDQVPPGTGSARIADQSALAKALHERVERPKRRSPLPDEDDPVVLTPAQTESTVLTFPDATPKRVMIVSRADVIWGSMANHWGHQILLEEDPAVRFFPDDDAPVLQVTSTGSGPRAVLGVADLMPLEPPAPAPLPPIIPNTLWPSPDTYVALIGDTITDLAARYLGNADRGEDIRALNDDRHPPGDDGVLFPGEQVTMPAGAMPEWMRRDSSTAAAAPAAAKSDAPTQFVVDVDAMHEKLFAEEFSGVERMLEDAMGEPPAVDPPEFPPPIGETVEYTNALMLLALQGLVDPPFIAPENER